MGKSIHRGYIMNALEIGNMKKNIRSGIELSLSSRENGITRTLVEQKECEISWIQSLVALLMQMLQMVELPNHHHRLVDKLSSYELQWE